MSSPCSVFHLYYFLHSFGSSACTMFCPNYKSSLCHVCSHNLNIDSALSCTLYLTPSELCLNSALAYLHPCILFLYYPTRVPKDPRSRVTAEWRSAAIM